jgi:hypothetical protein
VIGPSVRVDFYGVGSTAQTTQIQAVNSFGAGPLSPASANSATAAQFTDTFQGKNATYIGYGGSAVGMSSLWHNGYFDFANLRDVTPGTPTNAGTFVPTATAPAYPTGFEITNQKMLEVTPQGASGYAVLMNILQDNPGAGNNGAFGIVPYKYFFFLVYKIGATSGNFLSQPEFTANYEGVITGTSGATVIDQNQNWPINAFNPGITALFSHDTGAAIGYVSNTANTFQITSGSWNIGDHYNLQVGDQPYGTQISDYATYITAPSAGVFTANAWNVVKIPISVLGISGLNNDLFYKIGIGAPAPSRTDVFWLSCVGWSQ